MFYHHGGQCHDFQLIYDDYETRDDRHGVGDDGDEDIMMKFLSVCHKK